MYTMVSVFAIMTESTRSLLFGVFVLAGKPLTAAEVIRLTEPLGVSPTNAKSHLTRLVAEGAIDRRGPVRARLYTPSRSQSVVVEGIRARLQAEPAEAWDGTWLALTLRLPADRRRRERLTASLWFDGFRPWAPGTFLRPAWPERWALGRVEHYLAHAPGFSLRGSFVEPLNLRRVANLYELAALDRQARALAGWIRRQGAIHSKSEGAFAARLEVGGFVARLAGHDPRLPPELWGRRRGMRDLVRAYDRFDSRLAPLARRFVEQVVAGRRVRVGRDA
jgi:phenylacetic acid degradation operon negative regulatory protein